MKRKIAIMVLLFMVWPTACFADLTGKWLCNDGGTYYLKQIDSTLYWYGEKTPNMANVFVGTIRGNQVNGHWADVPKGKYKGHGDLRLAIKSGGNVLESVHKTGFAGSRWNREGSPPVSPPETKGNSTILGRVTGKLDLISGVRAENVDNPNLSKEVRVDANGRYEIRNLPDGTYIVYPQSRGKFSLTLRPENFRVKCQGRSTHTVNFEILGMMEG
jgi:hypothetical protein